MKKYSYLGFTIVVLLLISTGCKYDTVLPPVVEEEVSYSTDMQSFFDSKCIECHKPDTGIPLNLEADVSYENLISGAYVNTEDPSASTLYIKLSPGQSMEQYANDSERAMTFAWIEQGALNN